MDVPRSHEKRDLFIGSDLRYSPHSRCDDGLPGAHGLDQGEREGFTDGGHGVDVDRRQGGIPVAFSEESGEDYVETEGPGLLLQGWAFPPVTDQEDLRVEPPGLEETDGFEEILDAFLFLQATCGADDEAFRGEAPLGLEGGDLRRVGKPGGRDSVPDDGSLGGLRPGETSFSCSIRETAITWSAARSPTQAARSGRGGCSPPSR